MKRRTIGKIDPFFPGRMFPNESYFELIENDVPEEVRETFLMHCRWKRQLAELKKDPEAMMREVTKGLKILKERSKAYMEENVNMEKQNENGHNNDPEKGIEGEGKYWFISDEYDLEYLMKVFRDLYEMMENYAGKNPGGVVDEYKVKMFNQILTELKKTMPDHQVIQWLELLEEPEWEEDEETHELVLKGATNSDAMMLLAWYKNALT